MPAPEDQVLDVGSASLGDSQAVQAKKRRQRGMGSIKPLGREQERAELGAVHAVTLGRLHLGPAHVLRRVGGNTAVDVSEPIEPAHR